MVKSLGDIAVKKLYWVTLIMLSIALELVAIYYQYVLDEWPCVLCIHVRLWLMALIIVSVFALFINRISYISLAIHGITTVIMLAMLERSWVLLGVERGTIFGSCDMDLGLPAWLAIDKWIPSLFEVKTACGYTPVLFSGITMAEMLLVLTFILSLFSSALLVAVILRLRKI